MNKLAIPAILVDTVMVAGMFAFMPVEQASTVHTTVQASQHSQQTILLQDLTGLSHDGNIDGDFPTGESILKVIYHGKIVDAIAFNVTK